MTGPRQQPVLEPSSDGAAFAVVPFDSQEGGSFPALFLREKERTDATAVMRFRKTWLLFLKSPITENSTEQNCDGIRVNVAISAGTFLS